MIIIEGNNGAPMLGSGLVCESSPQPLIVNTPKQQIDVCFFDFEPEYFEWAFYDLSEPNNEYKNDFFAPLVEVPLSSDTVTFTLFRGSQETILNDDTYGTYYPFGSLNKTVNGVTFHELKTGYKINWGLVGSILGNGDYKLKISGTNAGVDFEVFSHIFSVGTYDVEKADGTVKIQSTHNGCVEGGFDYTQLNWKRSVRIAGEFGKPEPQFEENNFITPSNKVVQITAEMPYQFTLLTDLLPSYIWGPIIQDKYLADELFISDYNKLTAGKDDKLNTNNPLGGPSLFDKRPVRLAESPSLTHYDNNTRSNFEAVFIDAIKEPKKFM